MMLRHDNADLRLTERGRQIGLVSDDRWERFQARREEIAACREQLERLTFAPGFTFQGKQGEITLKRDAAAMQFIRRPDVGHEQMREQIPGLAQFHPTTVRQVEIEEKYAGYLHRERQQAEKQIRLESRSIPEAFDYEALTALSMEGRQKLSDRRPLTIGQASRIPGVTPADISVLLVALESQRRDAARVPVGAK